MAATGPCYSVPVARLHRTIYALCWVAGLATIALAFATDRLFHGEPGFGARQIGLLVAGTAWLAAVGFRGPLGAGLGSGFRWARTHHPRLLGLAVSSGILLSTLGALEAYFTITDEFLFEWPEGRPIYSTLGGPLLRSDPDLGTSLVPGSSGRLRFEYAHETVFDVSIRVDDHGRRITPCDRPESRAEFLLFLGCSYTFGCGVADEETLPFRAGRLAPRHRPYNFGVPNYGPHHALAQLRRPEIAASVAEPRGIAVFSFLEEHVPRAIGAMRMLVFSEMDPCFRLEDGLLVRRGSMATGRPARHLLWSLLCRSAVGRRLPIQSPAWIGDPELELATRILVEAKAEFERRFEGRFVVVLFPGPDRGFEGKGYASAVAGRLRSAGVEVLDYFDLLPDYAEPRYHIEADGHPTGLVYEAVAQRLVRDLGIDH